MALNRRPPPANSQCEYAQVRIRSANSQCEFAIRTSRVRIRSANVRIRSANCEFAVRIRTCEFAVRMCEFAVRIANIRNIRRCELRICSANSHLRIFAVRIFAFAPKRCSANNSQCEFQCENSQFALAPFAVRIAGAKCEFAVRIRSANWQCEFAARNSVSASRDMHCGCVTRFLL